MRFLLDEQLSPALGPALSALGEQFIHIDELGGGGSSDDQVVQLCRANDCEVLVTMNVRDFGARLYYYKALLDRGIHVVVGRWPRKGSQPDAGKQLALFAQHYGALKGKLLTADSPTLVIVRQSGIRVRDLSELVDEIDGTTSRKTRDG